MCIVYTPIILCAHEPIKNITIAKTESIFNESTIKLYYGNFLNKSIGEFIDFT